MDFAALVGTHHVARQHILLGIMFRHDARQQIALGRDHLAVFVGVFVQQRRVALLHQAADRFAQLAALFARQIPVMTVFNILARQLRITSRHQQIFYRLLDLMNIHAIAAAHFFADLLRDRHAVSIIFNLSGARCSANSLSDALLIKGYLTAVPFYHRRCHHRSPSTSLLYVDLVVNSKRYIWCFRLI